MVSGTVTLQLARHGTPMVIVYKSSKVMYNLLGRWIITTEHFTLPNLIAGREVVPEMVPYFDGPEPLVRTAEGLLNSQAAMEAQRDQLASLTARFGGRRASYEAANAIEQTLGLVTGGPVGKVAGAAGGVERQDGPEADDAESGDAPAARDETSGDPESRASEHAGA